MTTAELAEGAAAPDFTLPRDGGGEVSLAGLQAAAGRAVLLPQGRHVGLHERG